MAVKILSALVLLAWLSLSIYFGVGGLTKLENNSMVKSLAPSIDTSAVTYAGVEFANQESLMLRLEEMHTNEVFPWIDKVPAYCAYLITACSFGLLGGVIRLILELVKDRKPIEQLQWFAVPLLGLVSGIVVLGISFILPSLFIKEDTNVKSTTVMFFSLFAGIYSTAFYEGLSRNFSKLINNEKT